MPLNEMIKCTSCFSSMILQTFCYFFSINKPFIIYNPHRFRPSNQFFLLDLLEIDRRGRRLTSVGLAQARHNKHRRLTGVGLAQAHPN